MDFTECYGDTVSSVAAAARSGCRRRLKRLMSRGRAWDCRDNRGWAALHEAAAAGSAACLGDILAAARASSDSSSSFRSYVNSQTHEGESACHLAAQRGHLGALRLLLRAGADVDQLTNDLSCPLYAAVEGGHTEVVELLLRKGAEVNRTHTASCWTCLHQAVYLGHTDMVRLLVRVCDLEAPDDHGITPLFVAAQYGRRPCLELLLQAGANVNVQVSDLATPLMIAAQEGHLSCVELLLEHGADPNITCSTEWPQLPIHAAAEFGHVGILRKLIAVTDRACDRGAAMLSPLYSAVGGQRSQCVALLLSEGYSPDAQRGPDLDFTSPLISALRAPPSASQRECVRLLLSAGAALLEDPWIHALGSDRTELLDLILEHRWIPGPQALLRKCPSPPEGAALTQQEMRALVCVALSQVHFAACWLPPLLKAGLEPSLLLRPHMLEQAESQALNYLLRFVNWSTLPAPLKLILDQRRAEKSWDPSPYFDSAPSLSHTCRLLVRSVLGADRLMRSGAVRQLPVPSLLHNFLQFKEVPDTSFSQPPPSPLHN